MSNLFEYLADPGAGDAPQPPRCPSADGAATAATSGASASRTSASATRRPGDGREVGAAPRRPLHPARAEPRARRAERRRQDHAHQAAHAPLRADRGAHPPRRPRPARTGIAETLRARVGVIFQDFNQYQLDAARERRRRAASTHLDDEERIERAVERGGADEVVAGLPDGLETPARPLVPGRRRALRRAVAEDRAGARLHARGGRHPRARRADRRARRRGRARGLRALPHAGARGARRSSSRTASRRCAWPIASSCSRAGSIVEDGHARRAGRRGRALRAPLRAAGAGLPLIFG